MSNNQEEIKKAVYQLYRAAAKLNLYIHESAADKNRTQKELSQIKSMADKIITTINQ
ncbi:MAG: hypothetical protein ACI4C7_01515 [Clostridia bacterium]